ncbi:MAG: hypothetical protein IIB38_15065 [Candidatus Hydrogenedentes bacterium]|nr:hypothetical protein [Candidatus Hydrogenedentota bacterium]
MSIARKIARNTAFNGLGRAWEALWARAEEALGHRFCKNVIVSFQKPLRGGGD